MDYHVNALSLVSHISMFIFLQQDLLLPLNYIFEYIPSYTCYLHIFPIVSFANYLQ